MSLLDYQLATAHDIRRLQIENMELKSYIKRLEEAAGKLLKVSWTEQDYDALQNLENVLATRPEGLE